MHAHGESLGPLVPGEGTGLVCPSVKLLREEDVKCWGEWLVCLQ